MENADCCGQNEKKHRSPEKWKLENKTHVKLINRYRDVTSKKCWNKMTNDQREFLISFNQIRGNLAL